jgi:hypothetical protein
VNGIDPSRAYTRKAWLLNGLSRYRENQNETYAEMERLARRALEIEPYDAEGHCTGLRDQSLGRNAE